MSHKPQPVYFYIPKKNWADDLSGNIDKDWYLLIKKYGTLTTSWIVQTYLNLKNNNFPCKAISELSQDGIILACKSDLPDKIRISSSSFIVCVKADQRQHLFSPYHIVQNPFNYLLRKDKKNSSSYYMLHWPQPGLVSRDPNRGDKFENIAFFGDIRYNLAAELGGALWKESLSSLGLNWIVIDQTQIAKWNDYSYIDAIVAVRSFDKRRYDSKPASKLYNAWHAGVPAILGPESAYKAERKSELDYIEVQYLKEAIEAIKRLKNDKEFRNRMVENGRIRAKETEKAEIIKRWEHFLTEIAPPAYERWRAMPDFKRKSFLLSRFLNYKTEGLMIRLKRIFLRRTNYSGNTGLPW